MSGLYQILTGLTKAEQYMRTAEQGEQKQLKEPEAPCFG